MGEHDPMALRQARANEVPAIRALVVRVVQEVYGHLLPGGVPDPDEPWERSLVAVEGCRLVGVALTEGDRVEDLWIEAAARRRGLGTALLAAAEREIAARGHPQARLRLIAENRAARTFYEARGWRAHRITPHEGCGWPMLEMTKALASGPTASGAAPPR